MPPIKQVGYSICISKILYGAPVGVSVYAVQERQKGTLAFKDRLTLGLANTFKHGEQHGC